MAEWKLFDDAKLPQFLKPGAMAGQPWMNLAGQPGFPQRAVMIGELVGLIKALRWPDEDILVADVGCGDGEMGARIQRSIAGVKTVGYELGSGDVDYALRMGRNVKRADITKPVEMDLRCHLLLCSEVLEHLADPREFLGQLRDNGPRLAIFSSPSKESAGWHNHIHAWAWDLDGYRDLMADCGWQVIYQAECDGGWNELMGMTGRQRFQAVVVKRG